MKKYFQRLLSFIIKHKYYVLIYIILVLITIEGLNSYIDSCVESSYNEILENMSRIFDFKNQYGICDESYAIVSYKLDSVPPENKFSDKSAYDQQYGHIDKYYTALSGWKIDHYSLSRDWIFMSEIEPVAVGISDSSSISTTPEILFRKMYNNIISDKNFNIDVNNESLFSKLRGVDTRFHHLKRSFIETVPSIYWYDYKDYKLYYKTSSLGVFKVERSEDTIILYKWIISIILMFLEALVLSGINYYLKTNKINRNKNKNKNSRYNKRGNKKSNFKFGITLNKTTEEINENKSDVENLLEKINPQNFMNPYDAEKVKLANDLYSVLLTAKDNETIISMIQEKAILELGIEL